MPLPLRVYLDPELRIVHGKADCPAGKVARKYGYQTSRLLQSVEDARIVDAAYRPCDLCKAELEARRGPASTAPSRQHRYKSRRPA